MPAGQFQSAAVPAGLAMAVLLLAGCGAAREEQTPEQVQAEMHRHVVPRLGLWALHFEVRDMASPDAPAEALAPVRRELEARGRLGQLTCMTKETLAASRIGHVLGKSDMFCPPIHFKTDGSAYDGVWLCRSRHDDATVEARGVSTRERDQSTISANASIPGSPGGRFTLTVETTAEYKGDCPKG